MRELLSRAVSFFAKREMAGVQPLGRVRGGGFGDARLTRARGVSVSERRHLRRVQPLVSSRRSLASSRRRSPAASLLGQRRTRALFRAMDRGSRCCPRRSKDDEVVGERALVSSWLRWKERAWTRTPFDGRRNFSSNARWAPRSTDGSNTTRRRRICARCSPGRRRDFDSPPPPRRGLVGSNASTTPRREASGFVLSARRRDPRSTAGSSSRRRFRRFARRSRAPSLGSATRRSRPRGRDGSNARDAANRVAPRRRRASARPSSRRAARGDHRALARGDVARHARQGRARVGARSVPSDGDATQRGICGHRRARTLRRGRTPEHRARRVARDAIRAWYLEMWVSHRRREARASRALRGWRRAATEATRRRALDDVARASARRRPARRRVPGVVARVASGGARGVGAGGIRGEQRASRGASLALAREGRATSEG